MLKKLMGAQKEHMEKAQTKQDESLDKFEDKISGKYEKVVNELLLEGEEALKTYGLATDFAFITENRLVFVDRNIMTKKKQVVSIFFPHIIDVTYDYGHFLGEVNVTTSNATHTLKMVNKDVAQRFAMEIMQQKIKQ